MTRSTDHARWLQQAGARPVIGNALDLDWVKTTISREEPEVVIDQLTNLPQRVRPRGMRRFYRRQIPLREKGSGALLHAAASAGVRRVVSQSVAFLYAPEGGELKDETARAWTDAPAPFNHAVRGAAEHDERVVGSEDYDGLVLRYGVFYGPGTHFAPGNGMYEDIRRRRLPVVGAGDSVWSFVHVDDAAHAAVDALDHGAPGIYNVVDDDPAPTRVWIPELAQIIGAKPPRHVPRWLTRIFAGPAMAAWSTEFPGASNLKAKRELGWSPSFESWREGFRDTLSRTRARPTRS
jgi:nucleoside-diphosphate-sugar epimerase